MESESQSPLDVNGSHLERMVVGLRRWVPDFLHTYYVMICRPRDYFRQIRGEQAPANTVGPAAFWITNAVICKAFSTQVGDSRPFLSLATTSESIGLVVGTAICALYLAAIMDIRGWRGFRRMLRVVFTGSVFFIPMSLASLVAIPENLFESYLGPVLLGTNSSVRWLDLTGIALGLAIMIAWFLWVGFGIRQIFRKSRAAIALGLLAIPAFVISCVVILGFTLGLAAMRKQVSVVTQGFGPARVALMKNPPDYFASGRSFAALYKSDSPFIERRDRIRARIGSVAAGLASLSVIMKHPEAERKFYAAQNEVLAGNTEAAARILPEGVALIDRKGKQWRKLVESSEDDIREINRMMRSKDYSPWEPKDKKSTKSTIGFPMPRLFP